MWGLDRNRRDGVDQVRIRPIARVLSEPLIFDLKHAEPFLHLHILFFKVPRTMTLPEPAFAAPSAHTR